MSAGTCTNCAAAIDVGRLCIECAKQLAARRDEVDAVVEDQPRREEPALRREPVPGGLSRTHRKAIRYRLAQEFKVPVRLITGDTPAELRASATAEAARAAEVAA